MSTIATRSNREATGGSICCNYRMRSRNFSPWDRWTPSGAFGTVGGEIFRKRVVLPLHLLLHLGLNTFPDVRDVRTGPVFVLPI